MAKTVEFKYAPMFQVGEDKTEYRLLSKEGVTTSEFEGKWPSRLSTMWSSCCVVSITFRWLRS